MVDRAVGFSGTDPHEHDAPFTEGIVENMMEMLRDGVKGYDAAIEAVEDSGLADQLRELRQEREQMLSELTGVATRHGVSPEEAEFGTVGGALRRAWMGLKGSTSDDDAVLEVVESAERDTYEQFQTNSELGLPEELDAVVERHTQKLDDALDRIAALRS